MQLYNKELAEWETEELWKVSLSMAKVIEAREDLKTTSKYKKRFEKQKEPSINPIFIELKNAIDQELINRQNGNQND